MPNPKARQDDLVAQEIMDEFVIYDLDRDRIHALNPTAALVWRHCDGAHTPARLAKLLEQTYRIPTGDALLWLTLNRLEKAHLLAEKVTPPNGVKTLTRREVLKMVGVGVALLPVIKSIVAPTAAQAASLNASGQSCTTNSDCASGVCQVDGTCAPM